MSECVRKKGRMNPLHMELPWQLLKSQPVNIWIYVGFFLFDEGIHDHPSENMMQLGFLYRKKNYRANYSLKTQKQSFTSQNCVFASDHSGE